MYKNIWGYLLAFTVFLGVWESFSVLAAQAQPTDMFWESDVNATGQADICDIVRMQKVLNGENAEYRIDNGDLNSIRGIVRKYVNIMRSSQVLPQRKNTKNYGIY